MQAPRGGRRRRGAIVVPTSEAQLARHALRCLREARDDAGAAGSGRRGRYRRFAPIIRSPSISIAKYRSKISRPPSLRQGSRPASRSFEAWRSLTSFRATSLPSQPEVPERQTPQPAPAATSRHRWPARTRRPPRWQHASRQSPHPSSQPHLRLRSRRRAGGRSATPAAVPSLRRASGRCPGCRGASQLHRRPRPAATAEADAATSPAVAAARLRLPRWPRASPEWASPRQPHHEPEPAAAGPSAEPADRAGTRVRDSSRSPPCR